MDALRELLNRLDTVGEMSDEELAEFRQSLRDGVAELGDSDDEIALLNEVADAMDKIKAEEDGRVEDSTRRASERDAALARINGSDDGDDDEDDAGDESEADEPAETEPAEADAEAVEDEPAPEPVSAAAKAPAAKAGARRPSAAAMTAARPAAHAPRPSGARSGHSPIRLVGDIPRMAAGSVVDMAGAGKAMYEKAKVLDRGSGDGFYQVLSIEAEFPRDRQLMELTAREAMAAVKAVTDPVSPFAPADHVRAIVAAGGLCAPVQPYYGLAVVSDDQRPIKNSLPSFQAERGGITFIEPPVLTDILVNEAGQSTAGRAVTVHTEADDVAAVTKTVQTVACGETVEVTVDAIVKRLKFGNMASRAFPEQVQAWTELTSAMHARVAERKLITRMIALSTAASTAKVLGAARDVLTSLDRAYAAYVNRHRMTEGVRLHAWMPAWVVQLCRSDMTRQLASDMESFDTDAAWFRAQAASRGFNVSLYKDGPTGQDFGAQGTGALLDFPNQMKWVYSHEGAFIHLDGGSLDLGVVRDSVLNAANDWEFFAETWENVAFLGVEAVAVTSNVCATGQSSAAEDIGDALCNPAGFGS